MDTTTNSRINLRRATGLIRRTFQAIFFLFLGAANLSMTWENPEWLLTDADRQMEEEQNSPALSSGLHEEISWESFNQWQCFPISTVRLTCAQHALTAEKTPVVWTEIASVQIENSTGLMSFDFEDLRNADCNENLREIQALISEERSLCIYAAYLQEIDDNHSYWIPTVLKTAKGYWPNQNLMISSEPESKEEVEKYDR